MLYLGQKIQRGWESLWLRGRSQISFSTLIVAEQLNAEPVIESEHEH